VLQELGHSLKTVEDWMKVGALYNLGRFEEARAADHQGLVHIDLP